MVLDAVSNFVRGRADAQLTAGATTLSVEDASIFPDPATDGEYNVVIWDANNFPRPDQDSDVEIVRVTARDTGADELSVVRGQETTSDVAHPEGSAVHLSPTAKMFSDIEAEYTAQGENFDGQGTSEFENLQSVEAGSASINGPLDAESASVERATIDGNDVGFVGKSIDHDVTIEDGFLQFDNFSPSIEKGEIYVFEFSANRPGEGAVELRFNSDPDGNGNYAYFDESGTKLDNQDGVELFETTGAFSHVGGAFYVGFTDDRRPSVSPVPLFRFSAWDGFSQGGNALRDSDGITSIDIIFPDEDDNDVQMTKFYQRVGL